MSFYVNRSSAFSFSFYFWISTPLLEVQCHCIRRGIRFLSSFFFFVATNKERFFSVFGPWRGTLFKLSCLSSYERQLVFSLLVFAVIERFITSTCYNQITECIFLYNYFTINSRHSLVRISLFSLGKNIFEPQALFE